MPNIKQKREPRGSLFFLLFELKRIFPMKPIASPVGKARITKNSFFRVRTWLLPVEAVDTYGEPKGKGAL